MVPTTTSALHTRMKGHLRKRTRWKVELKVAIRSKVHASERRSMGGNQDRESEEGHRAPRLSRRKKGLDKGNPRDATLLGNVLLGKPPGKKDGGRRSAYHIRVTSTRIEEL